MSADMHISWDFRCAVAMTLGSSFFSRITQRNFPFSSEPSITVVEIWEGHLVLNITRSERCVRSKAKEEINDESPEYENKGK